MVVSGAVLIEIGYGRQLNSSDLLQSGLLWCHVTPHDAVQLLLKQV